MVEDIFCDLRKNIEKLYPKMQDKNPNTKNTIANAQFHEQLLQNPQSFTLSTQSWGYIETIEKEKIIQLAQKHDCIVRIKKSPGDYVLQSANIASVHGKSILDPELWKEILSCIRFGTERTPIQDIRFSIKQLVEIWVRALSPWINDPYTAIACLNNLASGVSLLWMREFETNVFYDESNKVRLYILMMNFTELVDISFAQICHYWASSPFVLNTMQGIYSDLLKLPFSKERKECIMRHESHFLKFKKRCEKDMKYTNVE